VPRQSEAKTLGWQAIGYTVFGMSGVYVHRICEERVILPLSDISGTAVRYLSEAWCKLDILLCVIKLRSRGAITACVSFMGTLRALLS
jgi:hypothetical protein